MIFFLVSSFFVLYLCSVWLPWSLYKTSHRDNSAFPTDNILPSLICRSSVRFLFPFYVFVVSNYPLKKNYLFYLEANYFTVLWWFLPYIHMNQPCMYMCPPSWTPRPLPSPCHPSRSSQCTSPEHPVSCIEPGLAIYFTYGNIHVSVLLSQIIPPSPSPTESKSLFFTSVSLSLSHIQGYCYHLSTFHIYVLEYCIGLYLSGLLHSV